jgi:hypothetical protein
MTDSKNLFLDKEIRLGGFYELAIQVCSSAENEPIKKYTDFIWALDNVQGPFDDNYNKIETDIDIFSNTGIIKIDDFELPFLTYNVRETEPIETGFNWFDICFYTAAIEKVFGSEYQTWIEKPKSPQQLDDFFFTTLKELFKIYPFKLAILGYEVSGQHYLDNLKQELGYDWTPRKFFIGQKDLELIAEKNKLLMTIID